MNSEIVAVPDDLVSHGGAFAWFTGVVEDVADPKEMGRVRVRCFGYHTADKTQIPTDKLPWAVVMLPMTSASMSGLGRSATGVLQGSWVIGFFRDGSSAQDPVILGTVPSISTKPDYALGFSDPTKTQPQKEGVDTPVEARKEFATADSYKARGTAKDNVGTVPTAVSGPDWQMPDYTATVKPTYPKNQVVHTPGGHVIEMDDTDSKLRIFEMHASGTYREIDNDGNTTIYVKGNNYSAVFGASNIYVKGKVNITTGACRHLVKGDYFLEVQGDKTEHVKGNSTITIDKDVSETVSGKHTEQVSGDLSLSSKSNIDVSAEANLDLQTQADLILKAAGDQQETVGGDNTRTIAGDVNNNIAGNSSTNVKDFSVLTSGALNLS